MEKEEDDGNEDHANDRSRSEADDISDDGMLNVYIAVTIVID